MFLATSDEFTARNAAELCGTRDRLKAHYSLSESGRDAHISLLTGRRRGREAVAQREQELRADHEYIFAPRVFTELQNAQAIVAAVRRREPVAAAVLLPEAALPRRADQLLRPSRSEARYEQPGSHPAVPAAHRGPAAGSRPSPR